MTLKDCAEFYQEHPEVLRKVMEDADSLTFTRYEDIELQDGDFEGGTHAEALIALAEGRY